MRSLQLKGATRAKLRLQGKKKSTGCSWQGMGGEEKVLRYLGERRAPPFETSRRGHIGGFRGGASKCELMGGSPSLSKKVAFRDESQEKEHLSQVPRREKKKMATEIIRRWL